VNDLGVEFRVKRVHRRAWRWVASAGVLAIALGVFLLMGADAYAYLRVREERSAGHRPADRDDLANAPIIYAVELGAFGLGVLGLGMLGGSIVLAFALRNKQKSSLASTGRSA
jgi:hypothetical protein